MRAWLADDVPAQNRTAGASPGGWGVALDGDPGTDLVWGRDESGPALPSDQWAFDSVAVRARIQNGFDDDGNPKWTWSTMYVGGAIESEGTRTEIDDAAGSTLVETWIEFGYPDTSPALDETAVVVDKRGVLWQVVEVDDAPGRCRLRIRSEARPIQT